MNQAQKKETMLGPYRVLDLTDEKGWLCGKILGDLGADVIKIERPGGDAGRNVGPFYHDIVDPEKSLFWFAYNTSKRGITLNLKTQDGKEIFKRLVKTAHFVLESFPPGYLIKLGLEYSTLSEFNPGLIVTSITPFGQTGPYKDYRASDIVAAAMGGMMFSCGDPDRPPLRCSVEQAYPQAGAQAAMATMIAHYYRLLTGEGQYIDVSMQECILHTLLLPPICWDINKNIISRIGPFFPRAQYKRRLIFPCKDGYVTWLVQAGGFGRRVRALVEYMDTDGMAGDLMEVDWGVSFDDLTQEQISAWEERFGKFFLTHTKTELHEEAVKRGILLFPVDTARDILANEQLESREFWVKVRHEELGELFTYPGAPFKSSGTPWMIARRAPLIGEHNTEIYQEELGFSTEELVILKENNVI